MASREQEHLTVSGVVLTVGHAAAKSYGWRCSAHPLGACLGVLVPCAICALTPQSLHAIRSQTDSRCGDFCQRHETNTYAEHTS